MAKDFSLVYRQGVRIHFNVATDSFGWLSNNYEINYNTQYLTWKKIIIGISKEHNYSLNMEVDQEFEIIWIALLSAAGIKLIEKHPITDDP